ncbi:UNVERIFIED_CONTAM: hypothetical protein RMT77_010625 [Armadillidium vulgare]
MRDQISLTIFLVALAFMSTSSEKPEDRCTTEGQLVCANCQTIGECVISTSGSFTVIDVENCLVEEGKFCDDTLGLPTGSCFRLNPMNTMCSCTRTTTCIEDPNSENVYIPCFEHDYGSPFYCPSENIAMDTCSCSVNPTNQ